MLVPPTVDCGYWLVGGRKLCEFKVRNDGGEGRFAIVPAAVWPAVSFKVIDFDDHNPLASPVEYVRFP